MIKSDFQVDRHFPKYDVMTSYALLVIASSAFRLSTHSNPLQTPFSSEPHLRKGKWGLCKQSEIREIHVF